MSSDKDIEKLKLDLGHYMSVFENSPMMIWVKDDKNNIIKVNRRVTQSMHMSAEEIESRTTWELFPNEADAYFKDDLEVINSGKPKLGIIEHIKMPAGQLEIQTDKVPWLDAQGKPCGIIAFVTDLTDRRKYEEEIFKAQKLKSLGILAGGLAHDLNNLLGGVGGNIDLACMSIENNQDPFPYLDRIRPVLEKASHLTRQLLTFAQGGAPVKTTASIVQLVSECINFFSAGSNVICELTVDPNLKNVDIDTNQISQVITNVIVNAQQAMPEGGKIIISIRNFRVTQNDIKYPRANAGEYVLISLRDYGHGIPENIIANIFDPFFTTKANGTGLGLSISHSIIKRHGGFIKVSPAAPKGTVFDIFLPASDSEVTSSAPAVNSQGSLSAHVLVMDDEQFILDVISDMLKNLGCSFSCVTDGMQAIAAFEEANKNGVPYDTVILDLTVHGGLGGKDTLRQLRKLNIPFKAIVSSGYSNDPVISSPNSFGFDAVLRKPYSIEQLRNTIQELQSNKNSVI